MFALRRVVARAAAAPSLSITVRAQRQLSRPYSIALLKLHQPSVYTPLKQQRWASDEAAETRQEPAADTAEESQSQAAAATAAEQAAQEAGEAPLEKGANKGSFTSSSSPQPDQTDGKSIFIANMFYETGEKTILDQFGKFGEIKHLKVAYDRRGMSKGYGWIVFANEQAAEEAIREMHNSVFDGRMIAVKASFMPKMTPRRRMESSELEERPENPPSRTLFIGNLSYEMTDVDLNELFRPIKNVVDIRVAIDRRTGRPRGFAHADFMSTDAATEAKDYLTKQQTYGRPIKVDYSATYSGKRRAE